jgi:DNA-binding NtrC family response regulator
MIRAIRADVLGDHFEVTCCANAASAPRELGRRSIDLVLLDRILPGGGSADLGGRAALNGIPTVWMTGDPNPAAMFGTGPHHVVAKPLGPDDLLAALAQALEPRCLPVGGFA